MLITLADAIDRFSAATHRHANSYNWYRKSAAESGRISLGGNEVPAVRQGRRWMIDDAEVTAAITAHQERKAHQDRMREDYTNHILHTGTGITGIVTMTDGGYEVREDFHFVWNDWQIARKISDGTWICNHCWTSASRENNLSECHRCSDWSPCGHDCTLSRIVCQNCGTSLSFGRAATRSAALGHPTTAI